MSEYEFISNKDDLEGFRRKVYNESIEQWLESEITTNEFLDYLETHKITHELINIRRNYSNV